MKPHGIILGVLMGSVLLLFGLVPDLFHGLMEGVRYFHDSISAGMPVNPRREHIRREHIQGPTWLVVVGAMFIGLSLFAYLSN